MKNLRLIVNNEKNNKSYFFNKKELQLILNLYALMVSSGEWKDYGLSISKKEISFNVYLRAAEYPVYKITKNLKPKNETEKYLVRDGAESDQQPMQGRAWYLPSFPKNNSSIPKIFNSRS